MKRRRFVKLSSGVATVGIAGCMNGGNGDNGGDNSGDGGGKGDQTGNGGTNNQSGGRGESGKHVVKMNQGNVDGTLSNYFDPVGLHVEKGDTVEWKVVAGNHTSTAYKKGNSSSKNTLIPEGAEAWDSGILSAGGTFSHTFEVEGTYDYFCVPHKTLGMTGRIVVGKPGGPGENFDEKVPDNNKPKVGELPPSKVIVDQGSVSYPYKP
ncbi:MAG: plastocyanin/azurin family copper-binding protein [Halobacteria archaeon]